MLEKMKVKKGGQYIGEGSYGCALTPAPQCTSEEVLIHAKARPATKKQVAKVFDKQSAFEEEWILSQRIAKLDPDQRFFVYPTSQCQTTKEAVENVAGANRCTLAFKGKGEMVGMMKMPNAGIALHKHVQKQKPSIRELLHSMLPVFLGVQRLVRANEVHHDLKFDNILFNRSLKECRVIDYGLMIKTQHAMSSITNPYIRSDYWLHPPEYRIYTEFEQTAWMKPSDFETRRWLSRNLNLYQLRFARTDPYTLADALLGGNVFSYCDYERDYMKYVQYIASRKSRAEMEEVMRKHVTKIDVYSLGVTLLYLSMYLNYEREPLPRILSGFRELLKGMLHPDPRKRFSSGKALRHVTELLRN
jgi:hypothetical protein